MRKLNLLVVDDDELIQQSIRMMTSSLWQVHCQAGSKVEHPEAYHAALVDIHLSGDIDKFEGLEVIRDLANLNPQIEVICISGDINRNLMEKALQAGASRFIAKPINSRDFKLLFEKLEAYFALQGMIGMGLRTALWLGESSASKAIRKQVAQLKGEDGPILLMGDSGVGKEVLAQIINQQDERVPFVPVNVAAIPENLFESELFGHVKGAFTGAVNNKVGLVEAAHGGDLFLDELEALPLTLQVKLLRFLETKKYSRLGDTKEFSSNVRILAATNRRLDQMVERGEFREDVYWRLKGKGIEIPPLRSRREDIAPIAKYFLEKIGRGAKQFGGDAILALENYTWPGNVRQLKRVVEELALVSPLPIIRGVDVNNFLPKASQESDPELKAGLHALIEQYTAQVIRRALKSAKDPTEAAAILKISRSTLYKKMSDLKIEDI